jgi:PII-like signaling protein
MQGYQISFMTEQDQYIEGKPVTEWLMRLSKEAGCSGTTTFAGVESFGSDGRRHSAKFFEPVDQPIEIRMVVTQEQADAIFATIKDANVRLFYTKVPVEYGVLGVQQHTRQPHVPDIRKD